MAASTLPGAAFTAALLAWGEGPVQLTQTSTEGEQRILVALLY
jgi:hypothetical protein